MGLACGPFALIFTKAMKMTSQLLWDCSVGYSFGRNAVTMSESFSARFPTWNRVGGRRSETSAVGLLPDSLRGCDIDKLLRGARSGDEIARFDNVKVNSVDQFNLMFSLIDNDTY
jgi:glucose-6-phosphate isomerase